MRRAGKLFNCPRVLKGCFNAYVLSSLEHCVPVWMPSAESHLSFLDSNVRNAEKQASVLSSHLQNVLRIS